MSRWVYEGKPTRWARNATAAGLVVVAVRHFAILRERSMRVEVRGAEYQRLLARQTQVIGLIRRLVLVAEGKEARRGSCPRLPTALVCQ